MSADTYTKTDASELSDAELSGVAGGAGKVLPSSLVETGGKVDHIQSMLSDLAVKSIVAAKGMPSSELDLINRVHKGINHFEEVRGLEGKVAAQKVTDAEKDQITKIEAVLEKLSNAKDSGSLEQKTLGNDPKRGDPVGRIDLLVQLDKLTNEFGKMQEQYDKSNVATNINEKAREIFTGLLKI